MWMGELRNHPTISTVRLQVTSFSGAPAVRIFGYLVGKMPCYYSCDFPPALIHCGSVLACFRRGGGLGHLEDMHGSFKLSAIADSCIAFTCSIENWCSGLWCDVELNSALSKQPAPPPSLKGVARLHGLPLLVIGGAASFSKGIGGTVLSPGPDPTPTFGASTQ